MPPESALTQIDVTGMPFDVGVQLGRFGKDAVHGFLTSSQAWIEVTGQCRDPRILHMQDTVRCRFPRYWQELEGLAAGLELPLDQVFAWHCRGDMPAMAVDGCTTIQLPGPGPMIAHNEDGDPGFRGHCALARIASQGGMPFMSFIYPGSLPGHSFACTDAGLVQTVNNIRVKDFGAGLPRMLLARAVLDCRNLDDAVTLLRESERAGAFHLTLAQSGDSRLLGVEFTATMCSVQHINIPSAHANHLIHDRTSGLDQIVTASSEARQRRTDELVQVKPDDLIGIMRDKGGPGLPVRRDQPDDPDQENTLATAIFHVAAGGVEGRVFDCDTGPAQFQFRQGRIT